MPRPGAGRLLKEAEMELTTSEIRRCRRLSRPFSRQPKMRATASRLLRSWLLALLLMALAVPSVEAACSDGPGPGVDWSRCQKHHKIIRERDLRGARFDGASLTATDLMGSNLSGASLVGSDLMHSRLSGANLAGADLTKIQGSRSEFEGADLAGATLIKAVLLRASLRNAILSNADLSKAELGRADMSGADLTGANLSYANIARASFAKAVMAAANFDGAYTLLARFEGVDLSAARGMTQDQLDVACGDGETIPPSGLDTPSSWPCAKDGD